MEEMSALLPKTKIPKKYQPKGFEVLYDDAAIIVGNKAAGYLTVGAMYDRVRTIHHALNDYVRKGDPRSRKCVHVVHRLDRETSGLLIFARTEQAKDVLKDNWKSATKTYYAVVHGRMARKSGTISSYLVEDDDYVVHSTGDADNGRLSHTAYTVVKETPKFSLLKIDLLTGRKNQIRVHLSSEGHPVVGDTKYGKGDTNYPRLALHAQAISFPHPVTKERLTFETELPEFFTSLVGA
jgi:tRNA pseudouridine32 synthase/23S rRNA pseudouridine746 synthase/23S rRNA pseudouridine1911/1915/1917 synthase